MNKPNENQDCSEDPAKEAISRNCVFGHPRPLPHTQRGIPEGNLTTHDIFQKVRTTDYAEEDNDLVRQSIAKVLSRLKDGTLNYVEAADILEMSLREFLEIFVVEEWLAGVSMSSEEKERLLDELTDQCERDVHGCTFRQFVKECVLDDDLFSALHIMAHEDQEQFAEKALAQLSNERLGPMLREQLSVGVSAQEFVQEFILPQTWFSELQIPDEAMLHIVEKAVAALCQREEYIFNIQWFSALAQKDRTIHDELVQELGEAIARRETERAAVLLAKWDHRTVLMSPNDKNAPILLSYYAQWIDFDSGYLDRVKELLPKFRIQKRTNPLEVAHFNIAEGLVEFHSESYDAAQPHFEEAMRIADELPDDDLIAISRYYLARCFWKRGLYKLASQYADEAIKRSDNKKRSKRVAAIKMVQGWLCFLKGDFSGARKLLEQAEIELKDTDLINHGNALSFYGRLDIKEERYEDAMKHFEEAIKAYLKSDRKHPHPNVARTHTNMAIACYDQAQRLPLTRESRSKLLELRGAAIDHLDAAQHIYEKNPQMHHRGLGKVHYLRGLLYASVNERDRAQKELEKAYELGEGKGDHVVMGRAKRIQFKITQDLVHKLALSEQTLFHAEQTNNRTLLARAYLNLASVLISDGEAAEGKHYITLARECLMPDELDSPYWREAIRRASNSDPVLAV